MIGQEEETADVAQLYVTMCLPGVFGTVQFDTARRFLFAMKVFSIPMFVTCLTLPLHILFNYLFVVRFGLGIVGTGYSSSLTYLLNFVLLNVYVTVKGDVVPAESWHFFNKDSFTELFQNLKFGIASSVMGMMDWIAFQLLIIFSGWISTISIATSVILLNLASFFFMFPLGMSFSIGVLVGNSLGNNKPRRARTYAHTSLLISLSLSL